MSDPRWVGIEARGDRGSVFAWKGSRDEGTFEGSLRLDVDGDVGYLASVEVVEGSRRRGLAKALFGAAVALAPGVRVVHAHLAGWEGDRLVTALERDHPDIEFRSIDA